MSKLIKSQYKILTVAIATGIVSQASGHGQIQSAGEPLRVRLRMESGDFQYSQSFEERIKELLIQRGIHSYGDIEIHAHTENNTVDLLCFDCVIVDVEMAGLDQPLNKAGGGGF